MFKLNLNPRVHLKSALTYTVSRVQNSLRWVKEAYKYINNTMTHLDILLQFGLSEVPDCLHDDLDLAFESSPNHGIETTTQFYSVLPLISSYGQVADVEFLKN